MGLDAFFLAKFKDNTPQEQIDKFDKFHFDDPEENENDPLCGLAEVGYFRSMWGLQRLVEDICCKNLNYDKYYFEVTLEELTDIYMYIWRLDTRTSLPEVDSWEDYYDIPVKSDYFESYGELQEADLVISDILRTSKYIDRLYYYGSW